MNRNQIWEEFTAISRKPDDQIDLARAALLISNGMNPRLNPDIELLDLDSLAKAAKNHIGDTDNSLYSINALSEFLFDELGFKGNEKDYYNPDNSFLDRVLTTRLGIPLSLSLLYIEIGKRIGMQFVGIGMPGHFLVRHETSKDYYIDTYNRGVLLSLNECKEIFEHASLGKIVWNANFLNPVDNKTFICRMLRNLKTAYLQKEDHGGALSILDLLLCIQPNADLDLRDRGLVNYRLGRYSEAIFDLKGYVARDPEGPDVAAVEELVGRILSKIKSEGLNGE